MGLLERGGAFDRVSEDRETPERDDSGAIAVLAKAFHVLETMADMAGPAPLREIAKATALPKGTLFRILQTMVGLGYVGQLTDSSDYYLTSQIAHLGRNARQEDIKMLAMPLMTVLHGKFNETINLGILEGQFVYYVAVMEAQRPLAWRVPAGTRDTFHSTALGRAIVAQLGDSHREALIRRANLKRAEKRGMTREALAALIEDARESRVAFDLEENDEGVVCIGTPIFIDSRVVAAVSVSIPAIRYTPALGEEIRQALLDLDFNFKTNKKRSSDSA